jgi:hypothetical protein
MKETEIDTIVDYFTEKLYSHQYFIGRKEAKEDLGLKTVVYATDAQAKLMTDLYEEYNKELEFGKMWNPENELGLNAVQNTKNYKIAFIESAQLASDYDISVEYRKTQVNVVQQTPQGPVQIPQEQVGFKIIGQGWK